MPASSREGNVLCDGLRGVRKPIARPGPNGRVLHEDVAPVLGTRTAARIMTGIDHTLALAVVVFVSTNVDDLFVLAAFFADERTPRRSVVVGQLLGMALLVGASAVFALALWSVPAGWTSLLGIVPLGLGLVKLVALFRRPPETDGDEVAVPEASRYGSALAVATVTIANGGDNLGVYVPLFAARPAAIAGFALVFLLLTALWCGLGFWLVRQRVAGAFLRRAGPVLLPLVLVAIGIHILWGAVALLP